MSDLIETLYKVLKCFDFILHQISFIDGFIPDDARCASATTKDKCFEDVKNSQYIYIFKNFVTL